MKNDFVLREPVEPYGEVRVDAKNRITLRPNKGSLKVSSYKVYRNSLGQYILDPQVTVPAHEAWLFQNEKAKAAVKKGLQDARAGKLVKPKEDFSKYTQE